MLWRQILRIVPREAALNHFTGIFRQIGRFPENIQFKNISSAYLSSWSDGISKGGGPPQREGTVQGGSGKKVFGPKITLIGTDENISVVSLEDGQKIAKRRNLRLVKMIEYDAKTQRPVYRLMSVSEFNEEHKKEKSSKVKSQKREKLITFSSRISNHDMQSKVKMVEKWLSKDYEVRVAITGDSNDMSGAEEVYRTLEGHMKERCRFLQKRQVNADIRFGIKSLPGSKSSATQETKDQKLSSADS